MKTLRAAIIFLLFANVSFSQNMGLLQTDSLRHALAAAKDDTTRVLVMANLAEGYRGAKPDSAILYGQQGLKLSQQIKFRRGEVLSMLGISVVFRELGSLPKALEFAIKGLEIAQKFDYPREKAFAFIRIANVYVALRDFRQALNNFKSAETTLKKLDESFLTSANYSLMGDVYEQMNQLDSALFYQNMAYHIYETRLNQYMIGSVLRGFGNIYSKLGNNELAAQYFKRAIRAALEQKDHRTASNIYTNTATFYLKLKQTDSAIYFAKKGLEYAQLLSYKGYELRAATLLSQLFENIDPKESLRYYKIANVAKDSLYSSEKVQALQAVTFEEQQKQKEAEAVRIAYQNKVKQYALLAGLAVFLLIMLLLYRNNRKKQLANKLLERQKVEIQNTLTELRTTQAQLVHSEKMASLGELTAGIAHEIQNPLNFVNNFSEVSNELLEEMKTELAKGNNEEVAAITDDVRQNLQKILHHGKRADAIVKGMLQHSRSGSGQKEPTDINSLADEYLRLAYHGLRAKDKSFNANFETNFDSSIGKLNIVPQDIGRVVLNLINNAFYTVAEKKKQQNGTYEPMVRVTTRRVNGRIELGVKDNGNGIPQKSLDKIFQPFFTTKPTGEGTGLGLSLAYDIVTKGHGGELKVTTNEGEGSEFIIQLPNDKI